MRSTQNTDRVLKDVACKELNSWLMNRGYIIPYYDGDNANFTIVMLGVLITAFNYAPEKRKEYAKEYKLAKKLFKKVHSILREYELEHCQGVPFSEFPSEKLRAEIQKKNEANFANGFSDIKKYLENIDIKLIMTIGRDQNKKKKKNKKKK